MYPLIVKRLVVYPVLYTTVCEHLSIPGQMTHLVDFPSETIIYTLHST